VLDGFIVDFRCPVARLVLEIDGEVHDHLRAYDMERDAILAGHGLRIMRIANDEVNGNLSGVLERILAACQLAIATLPDASLSAAT
jgi:very-short-patch-repair endonuclease